MRDKARKILFIIQLSEGNLKLVKCSRHNNAQAEFLSLSLEPMSSEKELAAALGKQGFKSNEIVAALPRNQATCRFLKIPGKDPAELEKMSALQAGRYLPYPAQDLVTAYQIIRTDKEDFSDIILTIAHKNSILAYLNILSAKPRCAKLSVILSSYGICNLFYHLEPKENATLMLIDLDSEQAELVIVASAKALFSRSVKLNRKLPEWEGVLSAEITKTADAFVKEAQGERIKKIIILGVKSIAQESSLKIEQGAGVAVEFLNYAERLNLKTKESALAIDSNYSFASLLGLALKGLPETLNILPKTLKEKNLTLSRQKEQLKLGILIIGIIFVWFLGIAKNLSNKESYLQRMKKQLNEVAQEARPLEGIEKRFQLIENNAGRNDSPLDILYELHRLMPQGANLMNLTYEENRLVALHGTAGELNSVFNLVSALEKSPAFSKFNIKIRFATRKKTQTGELVDFEIGCAR